MEQTIYNKRYLTRVVIEAATPLAVGTGNKSVLTDALVARDLNGLPYIPGSSLAGVLRHIIGDDNKQRDSIFGFQDGNKGHGSRIIFTDAVLLDADGEAQDGLIIGEKSAFLSNYDALPTRQHVRINQFGSTDKGGKFDEQVVYQGTRFVFEIEMVDNGDNKVRYCKVLDNIFTQLFRVGGGTRSGFGAIRVIDMEYRLLDLSKPEELELYITKSSSLKQTWEGYEPYSPEDGSEQPWHEYVLELKPLDFYLFSSGFSDDDADTIPVTESYVVWNTDGMGQFVDDGVLIPATSFKGALAHRVAYHWNKIKGFTAESGNGKVGDKNEAVVKLFGSSGSDSDAISRGNVLLSDVILEPSETEQDKLRDNKLLNHVTIDRITGGTIAGHLFTEKVTHRPNQSFKEVLYVNAEVLRDDDIKAALERSLQDICDGLLPLGGGTNRGHGIFTGSIIKGIDNNGN